METSGFSTYRGIPIEKIVTPLQADTALKRILEQIDTHKGALLVSNYEVPDRYSRWDIGFVNPPLELVARERSFVVRALNKNGRRLLPLIQEVLQEHPHLESFTAADHELRGTVQPMSGWFPEEERSRQPSLFSVLRAIQELFRCDEPYLGLYGALGYDLVFQFENLQARHERPADQNDCHLYLPTDLVVVDRQKELAYSICYRIHTPNGWTEPHLNTGDVFPLQRGTTSDVQCDHQEGEFEEKVQQIRAGCQRGDFYEVVLSQAFSAGFAETPSALFQRICERNPSPYSFLLNFGTEQLVGASPEMYIRVKDGRFETCPISGTVAVGDDAMETAERIKALIGSAKEESELTMCTDVDRNDMSRICEPGSVTLLGRRLIEKYSRLIHTVDHVEGQLAQGFDAIDALLTHMWACTVTGSPKPIAMQTIEDLENSPRRWYSGAVGFLWFNGYASTGMTLRTVHLQGGTATIRAGATLLFHSDPKAEEQETRTKASAFLDATLGRTKARVQAVLEPVNGQGKTVLFVDHHDSFVHTLAGYVRQTGARVVTLRAGFPYEMIDEIRPDLLFLSPGPKTPRDQQVPKLVGEAVRRQLSVFGVCLGHQGIAEHFGGELKTFAEPYHGQASEVQHDGTGIFLGLPQPFRAARYHSLYVDPQTVPAELEVTAKTSDGVIMGLRHRTLPITSVQFHPESILTLQGQAGLRLLDNVMGTLG
jgi:anthranilate synthase